MDQLFLNPKSKLRLVESQKVFKHFVLIFLSFFPLCFASDLCEPQKTFRTDLDLSWSSQIFTGRPVSSAQEARVVTETIINSTQAREEISTFFDSFGGLAQLRSNPRLWDLYLKAYDRVPTKSREYQALASYFDEHLPKSGLIADFGAGTGAVSLKLLERPERTLFLIDNSEVGLALAQNNLRQKASDLGLRTPYFLRTMDLNDLASSQDPLLDGFVMNNVLYSIKDKLGVLRAIRGRVKKGAIGIISDPNAERVSAKGLKQAVLDTVVSAVEDGARPTDFEIALGVFVNLEILGGQLPPFILPQALVDLAQKSGFKVTKLNTGSLYFGIQTILVLEAI